MIDVWNLFLWCKNEIQVLHVSQDFLKTPTLYAVPAEVTKLNNRKKISKRHHIFPARGQPWNNSQKRKSFLKNYRFKHELKLLFFLIFTLNWGSWKTMGQAVIPGNFKRYERSPNDSGVLFYWLTVHTCIFFNQPAK